MRTLSIPVAAAVSAAFLGSCGEPVGHNLAPPLFNFTNGPASPGPNIIRSATMFAVFHADNRRGVSAVYGTDVVQLCLGNVAFDVVSLQEITVPQEAGRFIDLIQGAAVTASVWPFTAFDCTLFLNTAPLATGLVDLVNTDNDLLVFLRDNTNANAFGFTAQGTLTRPSGARAHVNSVSKVVWDGLDGSRIFKATDVINVR